MSSAQVQREKTTTQPPAPQGGPEGKKTREPKSALRGMDFAQGAAALSDFGDLMGSMLGGAKGTGKGKAKPGTAAAAEGAAVEGGSAEALANAQGSLDEAAADAQKNMPPGANQAVDRTAAFAELKRRCMAQIKDHKTSRAKKVWDTLEASWNKLVADFKAGTGKDPGPKEAYISKNWFDSFYYLKCKDYAIDLVDASNTGTGAQSLRDLIATTDAMTDKGKHHAIKGRSLVYRGSTVAELAAQELANPTMQPGCAVHVKLHFEEDGIYQTEPDAHHWIVYDGGGRFSHSFGTGVSGKDMDGFLHRFAKKYFPKPGYKYNRKHWKDPRFSANPPKGVPRDDILPKVSAVYDAKEAGAKNKGGDAG